MRHLWWIVFALAFSIGHQASADPYSDCIDANATNAAWADCTETELKRQEALLTAAWKKASQSMKRFSEEGFKMLLEEQRAWIRYKDKACAFFGAGLFGREGTVLHYGSCMAKIISGRTSDLTSLEEFVSK